MTFCQSRRKTEKLPPTVVAATVRLFFCILCHYKQIASSYFFPFLTRADDECIGGRAAIFKAGVALTEGGNMLFQVS